jgi:uncharacterized protein (TIGR04141 family)
MRSANATSLYRLAGGRELSDYLVPADLDSDTPVHLDDIPCRLVTGALRSDRPKWADQVASLTGAPADLPGVHPFAILLIPLDSWTYALTWGSGHLLLEDEFVEQGFGLLFGIRRLDSERLAPPRPPIRAAATCPGSGSNPTVNSSPGWRARPTSPA